ncbi:YrdB family protein [Kitasatospora sp. NPDC059571]|uniref:YrdB family protein n=1 Tax=Kitasatospora sp. NPDC059571 TaxID=3346871 RepID=UPI0036A67155
MRGGVAGIALAVRFLLELAALAALGYGGWAVPGPVALRVVLAVLLPLAAALLWGRYASPRAVVKSPPAWLATQLLVFGGAVLALALAGRGGWALVLAAVMVADTALLAAYGEWRPPVREPRQDAADG